MSRKILKEQGLFIALFLHWCLYYFALYNNAFDTGFDGRLNYSIQWGSLPFLGIGIAIVFSRCMDDCNIKYLHSCIFSLTLRFIIIIFKPWGFEDSMHIMVICGLAIPFWFACEYLYKKSKRDKLYI